MKHVLAKHAALLTSTLILTYSGSVSADEAGLITRWKSTGGLDPTFDTDGMIIASSAPEDTIVDAFVGASQEIVTCGTFTNGSGNPQIIVSRLLPNGAPDPSFGFGGVATAKWLTSAITVACAWDFFTDKVVVVANVADGWNVAGGILVVRFKDNGGPDESFGEGGFATLSVPGVGGIYAGDVFVNSSAGANAPSYVVGEANLPGGGSDAFIVKLDGSGNPDASFAGDGVLVRDYGGHRDVPSEVIVSGGKVLVGATIVASPSSTTTQAVVARHLSNGSLDSGWASDGTKSIAYPAFAGATISDIEVQPDGKVLAVGSAISSTTEVFSIARLQGTNGSFDNSFSNDGRTTEAFAGPAIATSVAWVSTGIYVAGHTASQGKLRPTIMRFTPGAGARDLAYPIGQPNLGSSSGAGSNLAMQGNLPIMVGHVF